MIIAICVYDAEPTVVEKLKSYPFVDIMFGTHNIYNQFIYYIWKN